MEFIFKDIIFPFLIAIGIGLVSILVGCSTYKEILDEEKPEPQIIEKECEPIIKKEIEYIDRNITIPCNITYPKYNYTSATSRELELIRRIKFLEGQTDKYFNDSECNWELNKTKVRLEDCEYELCYEWNSSWC